MRNLILGVCAMSASSLVTMPITATPAARRDVPSTLRMKLQPQLATPGPLAMTVAATIASSALSSTAYADVPTSVLLSATAETDTVEKLKAEYERAQAKALEIEKAVGSAQKTATPSAEQNAAARKEQAAKAAEAKAATAAKAEAAAEAKAAKAAEAKAAAAAKAEAKATERAAKAAEAKAAAAAKMEAAAKDKEAKAAQAAAEKAASMERRRLAGTMGIGEFERSLEADLPRESIDRLFAFFDANGDGRIDATERKKMVSLSRRTAAEASRGLSSATSRPAPSGQTRPPPSRRRSPIAPSSLTWCANTL